MSEELSAPKAVAPEAGSQKKIMWFGMAGVAAIAASAGMVFGFISGGGGVPADADPAVSNAAVVSSAVTPAIAVGPTVLPSLADIVQRVSPAVVSIRAKVSGNTDSPELKDEDFKNLPPSMREFFERFRRSPDRPRARGEVQGSGFVVDDAGYVVTNNHVIANAVEIEVVFSDGRKVKAKSIGRDELTDIAVLKLEGSGKYQAVTFADDRTVRVGDWVLAVGNPFGLDGTVTAGIVSARSRDDVGSGTQFTDYLQIDASINRGNSGGPTFDLSGRVIGMNTAIFSPTGGSVGIGFAIPSNTVRRVVDDLRKSGSVTRGWLGVQIQSMDEDASQSLGLPNNNGAIVAEVIDGSPAEKSGFRQGDVVLKMNGTIVKDNRDLSRRVAALQVGETARFGVWRENREIQISVLIAKRPDPKSLAQRGSDDDEDRGGNSSGGAEAKVAALGLELSSITPAVRSEFELERNAKGVVILDVDSNSDAAERGLQAGDRIVAVAGREVNSVADVNAAVAQAKSLKRPSVLLFVERGRDQRVFIPVKLKRG